MANNCLKTTLKGADNNNALETLGAFSFYLKADKNANIQINTDHIAFTATIIGNGSFADSSYVPSGAKTQNSNGNGNLNAYIVPTEDCRVEITGVPYGSLLSMFAIWKNAACDLGRVLKYWKGGYVQFNYTVGSDFCEMSELNLDDISNPETLTNFLVGNRINNATGNISVFSTSTELIQLNLAQLSGVAGNISSLANCVKLTEASFGGTQVTGVAESFAIAMAAGAARDISFVNDRAQITLNSKRIVNNMKIKITSASDIKFVNNVNESVVYAQWNGTSWSYDNGYQS